MASSSSSSSHVHQIKYDVFISFRGFDTRYGFLSHLTKELRQKHIHAYVDERLEGGEEISPTLLKAIEGSLISLIIFSKNYASSKWCLEELVKIIQCKEVNNQFVIPVFYNIDPSDVRHQKGTYGDTFVRHQQKFKDNMEKLQTWRSALNKAANLSGYHYSSNFEHESELIDEIVKGILKKLDGMYPIEPKDFVGIDHNFAFIESLLKMESKQVRILGIWGMGGIGKTTLARAVCDKFSSQFESCCFLENLREESKKNGMNYLLKKFFSEVLEEENLLTHDTNKADSNLIKRRLSRKKVLIVLDDVDTREKLEYLVGEPNCLGPGSRVIITNRDKHILKDNTVDAIHEVQGLNFQDSLILFSVNAFNQSHPKLGYKELSKRVVVYAKGNTLALKILGSYFHSRNMETWESALKKFQKYPNVQIQNILKFSYDGLDEVEKNIFLDIAFFFKGECKDDVKGILDACGLYAASGIDNLLNKALISISNNNRIEMHDLLQQMGEQIVHEESIKDPGRRSRLRDVEGIYDVLKNNTGTDRVEGIILNMSQIKDVHLDAYTFKKMPNLRILKFYSQGLHKSHVNLPFGLASISNKLRYFHWGKYPLKSLPSSFCPEKLVELHMEDSHVKKLWDGVQDLVNLKIINLEGSKQLRDLPDFSMAHNLQEVDLTFCESLQSVHSSILSLPSLLHLSLTGCEELKTLECGSGLKSLNHLALVYCYSLKELLLPLEEMKLLSLPTSKIKVLHSSIRHLHKLKGLCLGGLTQNSLPMKELCCSTSLEKPDLAGCGQVIDKMQLRTLFDALPSLEDLFIVRCSNLCEIPDNINSLSLLRYLSLSRSKIESLPASVKHLLNLETMRLAECTSLRSIPELPPSIRCLDARGCTSLQTVFPLKTSSVHDHGGLGLGFVFEQCVKLDEHSLCHIMEFTRISMVGAIYNNCQCSGVCYPGSRVPKWFRSNKMGMASVTIEVAPTSDELVGLVCCCVLPQFASEEQCKIIGKFYFEDEEEIKYETNWPYFFF